jgi:hypothetical protein
MPRSSGHHGTRGLRDGRLCSDHFFHPAIVYGMQTGSTCLYIWLHAAPMSRMSEVRQFSRSRSDLADSMSLPETEKEKGLASSEAEDVLPQEEKQPEGSFKDYLVREALSRGLQEHS